MAQNTGPLSGVMPTSMAPPGVTAPPLGLPKGGGPKRPPAGAAPRTTSGGAGGGGFLRRASRETRRVMQDLGIPRIMDLITGKIPMPGGIEGANLKEALGGVMKDLTGFRESLDKRRAGFESPTDTKAFRNLMSLQAERTGRAVESENVDAARAASRRGYAGGYDPRRSEDNRMQAVAESGFAAADAIRGSELEGFKAEAGVYGSALDAYRSLSETQAQLPAQYLSAFGSLMGGSSPGSLYGTVLGGMEGQQNRKDEMRQRRMQRNRNLYKAPVVSPGARPPPSPTTYRKPAGTLGGPARGGAPNRDPRLAF